MTEREKAWKEHLIRFGTFNTDEHTFDAGYNARDNEVKELKNALSCAEGVIMGEMAGYDYKSAMDVIRKALEKADE